MRLERRQKARPDVCIFTNCLFIVYSTSGRGDMKGKRVARESTLSGIGEVPAISAPPLLSIVDPRAGHSNLAPPRPYHFDRASRCIGIYFKEGAASDGGQIGRSEGSGDSRRVRDLVIDGGRKGNFAERRHGERRGAIHGGGPGERNGERVKGCGMVE